MDNTTRQYTLPGVMLWMLPCLLAGFQEFSELKQANKAILKYNDQSSFQVGKATYVSHTPRGLQ